MDKVTLREYVDTRFSSLKEATQIAVAAMDKRLESMNEFRDALKDQAGRFITREELKSVVSKLDADIEVLKTSKAKLEGAASQTSVYIGYAIALVSILISLFYK